MELDRFLLGGLSVEDTIGNTDYEKIVNELLDTFYQRRIEKINSLELKQALTKKNPYLYKATGYEDASNIIKEILSAYMSSSDEGIFGDAFFEVLAERVSGGTVAEVEGIDIIRIKDNLYEAIAVKSGTSVFNASSRKKQIENFNSLRARVAKRQHVYRPIIGYGYGRKNSVDSNGITELAGQAFWEEITGNPNFFIEIIHLIGDKPQHHLIEYKQAFDAAVNRFTREFTIDFCNEDGTIDWEKLVRFNSGKQCKKLETNYNSPKSLDRDQEAQLEVTAIHFDETREVLTGQPLVTYIVPDEYQDLIQVREDGVIRFKDHVEGGTQVKIGISCYGKTISRTFKLKKERRRV